MLSERQLDALMEAFTARMQRVVDQYLQQAGEHLRDIGQLTPTDAHRLTELKRLSANARRIKREIARAARLSVRTWRRCSGRLPKATRRSPGSITAAIRKRRTRAPPGIPRRSSAY